MATSLHPLCPKTDLSLLHTMWKRDFNENASHQLRLRRLTSLFVPIRQCHALDVSDQYAGAAVNLTQEPQQSPIISAAVVADAIHARHRCPGWNRMSNRLDQGQQIPLAGSRQRETLALSAPADPHEFSIRPSPPVIDSKRRLTG